MKPHLSLLQFINRGLRVGKKIKMNQNTVHAFKNNDWSQHVKSDGNTHTGDLIELGHICPARQNKFVIRTTP